MKWKLDGVCAIVKKRQEILISEILKAFLKHNRHVLTDYVRCTFKKLEKKYGKMEVKVKRCFWRWKRKGKKPWRVTNARLSKSFL